MQKSRVRNPAARLPRPKHERLVNELEELRTHLHQLIVGSSAGAGQNQELSDILEVAKKILGDCDEMLKLLL